MNRRTVVLVAAVAAVVGGVIGYFLLRTDSTEFDSVALLVDALDAEGLRCGGELTIHVSRGVSGEEDPFENGSCPTFAGDDQGDFFTFNDRASVDEYVKGARERSGGTGISGVLGQNWIVSVRLESTARQVQEAIGGQVVGY